MPQPDYIVDGDFGWTGVDDRMHPSQLPPGKASKAVNTRFDYGEAWPRWCVNVGPWSHASKMGGNPLAISRWFEPQTGEEALVVVTDDIRDGAAEDGGRGRAYKIRPGGIPSEIPLNGFDVWDTCRLVPGRTGLLLLRHGNDRHYIPAASVDTSSGELTLNAATTFVNGDLVTVRRVEGAVPNPLVQDTSYYVKVLGSGGVKLYTDAAITAGLITPTDQGGGRFAIERTSDTPGPGGNGAPTLICERSWTSGGGYLSAWVKGFSSVPITVTCTLVSAGTTWVALNHRFSNGQTVELTAAWTHTGGVLAAGTNVYAHYVDPHRFTLHSTLAGGLLGGTTDLLTDDGAGGDVATSVRPDGYGGQPIVPCREGVTFKTRFIGLNGRNNIAVSDPGDFLHFTPFTGALTDSLGNGDPLTTIIPMGEDSLVLASASQTQAVIGLSVPDSTVWQLQGVSQEYGCIAPLSAVQVGRDVWFLSRAGVVSVKQTDFGKNQGVAKPVSEPISRKMSEIDWDYADQACSAWYANKFICAVPLKGQSGTPVNNCLLVFNFLTQAWDHYWEATGIRPIQFARLTIGKTERLCWLDQDGSVKWFDDIGWEDISLSTDGTTFSSAAVATELVTRGLTGGNPRRKQWQEVEVVLDTINPSWSLATKQEGFGEETAYRTSITRDPSKFLTFDAATFLPATESERAALPYREDYSWFMDADTEMVPSGATYGLISGFPGLMLTGLTVGKTYTYTQGNATALTDLPWQPGGGMTFISAGNFVATRTSYYLNGNVAGLVAVTASVVEVGGFEMPDDGIPTDAHQQYQKTITLRDKCRSEMVKITNAQGSIRIRSVHAVAKQEKGDW